jgi:hypothetical protein
MYASARTRSARTVIALPSGRFLLGALTPEQATEQIFPQAKVGKGPGHDQTTRGYILSSAQAAAVNSGMFTTAYMPGEAPCGQGVSMVKPALLSTTSGLALKFTPQAFAAGPIVGGIVLAIAGISKLFSVIFSHHAAAMAKEQSTLCAAVPAANQSLELIDQAVAGGQATPQDGITALDAVVSGFRQAVAGIIKGSDPTSSGECNAACENLSELRAYVLLKQSQYKDLAAAQSASPTSQVASAIASGNIPSLLPWAAAGLGLLLLLKEV